MTKEQDNKAVVGRWFADFWGKTCNLSVVDELADPKMLVGVLTVWVIVPNAGLELFITGK